MARSFEEVLAAKPQRSFDEVLAAKGAQEEKEYSLLDKGADLGRQVQRSAIDTNAGLLDISGTLLNMPRAVTEFAIGDSLQYMSDKTGIGDYVEPYPEHTDLIDSPKAIWERASALNQTPGSTGQGASLLRQARQEETAPMIPEGAAGPEFEIARDAASIAGEYVNPTSVIGGPANAVRGAIGGITLGTIGEQFGDTEGIAGTIIGDLLGVATLRDPKQIAASFSKMGDTATSLYRSIVNTVKGVGRGKSGLDPKALVDTATSGDNIRATRELIDSIALPREINDIADPRLRAEAVDEFMIKFKGKIDNARANGETGSIGQITGNEGVLAYERESAKQAIADPTTPEARRTFNQQQDIRAEIDSNMARELDALSPGGVAKQATEAPREGLNRARGGATRVADEATEGLVETAEAGLAKTNVAAREAEKARQLSVLNEATLPGNKITAIGDEGVAQIKKISDDAYDSAWGAGGKKTTKPGREALATIEENLDLVGGPGARSLANIKKDILKLADSANGRELLELDELVRNAISTAKMGKKSATHEVLQDVKATLRGRLPVKSQRLLTEADAAYPKYLTVKKSSEGKKPFLRGGEFTGAEMVTPAGSVRKTDRPLGTTIRQMDAADTAEAAAIKSGEEGVDVAQAQVKALRKAEADKIKAIDESPAGVFSAAEGHTVDRQVEKLIKGGSKGTPVAHISNLLESVKGSPEKLNHIKRAFRERFMNTVSKDGTLTQDGLKEFQKMKPIYEETGLFTADELKRFEKAMTEGQKNYMTGAEHIAGLPPEQMRLGEIMSGLVGAKVGAFAFGSPLIGAAYGRKIASKQYEAISKGRIKDLAYELSMNPEKFSDQLAKLKRVNVTAEEFDSLIKEMIDRLPAPVATVTGSEIQENN